MSAEELLERAWDENADPFTNAVRITVSALRKRLGEPWIIATVAGVGYRIDAGPDARRVGTRPWLEPRAERAAQAHPQLRRLPDARRVPCCSAALVWLYPWARSAHARRRSSSCPATAAAVLREFAPIAGMVLAFLLVFGLLGGWLLAGRMLAPLRRITDATRVAASGSLSHRIRLTGPHATSSASSPTPSTRCSRGSRHMSPSSSGSRPTPRTSCALRWRSRRRCSRSPATIRERDDDELLERLHAVNARAIDLTEALLVLSRADQRSFPPEHGRPVADRRGGRRDAAPARREARRHDRDLRRRRPPPSARRRCCCR